MFDWLKNPILKRLIGRGVRVALVAFGAWLLKQGIGTSEEIARFIDGAEPVIGAAIWLAWEVASAKGEQKVAVALKLPAGATRDDLNTALKRTPPTAPTVEAAIPRTTPPEPRERVVSETD